MTRPIQWICGLALLVALALGTAPTAQAQPNEADPAMAFSEPERVDPKPDTFPPLLKAICWYIPNRVADLFDIPAIYLTMGDGNGASLRLTRLISANYFENSAMAFGWNPRGAYGDKRGKTLVFDESIHEEFFQFLFAYGGEVQRDPTEIGASLHFVSVGANVGLSLGEAVDFFLGFLTIDLYGDDYGPFFNDKIGDRETIE